MIDYDLDSADGVCTLRLNGPPLNTLTFDLLDALVTAVDRANADAAVRAIIIIGTADHFSAGADVNLFKNIETADDAIRVSRVFQEAFQRIEDSAKPVGVAMAGQMIGGALELAAACHVRVCTPRTKFMMPEVNLGINPGAGGTTSA